MSVVRVFALAAVVLGTNRPVAAQVGIARPLGAADGPDITFVADRSAPSPGLLAVEPYDTASSVVDRPYMAEAVTEVTQVLADGNRIEHRTTTVVARDSKGRTRREHQAVMFGPVKAEREVPLVTISDPSAGTHVVVDQEQRTAFRMQPKGIRHGSSGEFNVRVGPGLMPGRAAREARNVKTESLGTREIEGVKAEGTRTVVTIPAGSVGNHLPIEIVSERWYSPELQVTVMSRRSDPRFGETIYRLTNIVQGEPPADLFDVPQGFDVKEGRPTLRKIE
jgi:hypothetical protein